MCDSPTLSPSSHSSKTAEQHVLQQQQRAAMVQRLREDLGPTVDAQLQKGGEEGLTDAVRDFDSAPRSVISVISDKGCKQPPDGQSNAWRFGAASGGCRHGEHAQPCRVNRDKGCAGSNCFADACKLLRSRTAQPRGVARHVMKSLFKGAGCSKHASASMHAPSAAFAMQQGMRHGDGSGLDSVTQQGIGVESITRKRYSLRRGFRKPSQRGI